jgi:hypothetical protein
MYAQHIENEAAYEAAIQRRIKLNARKGWIARDPSRLDLEQRLQAEACRRGKDSFMGKMWDSLEKWGKLSEKQEAAILRIWADDATKRDQRKAERLAADAGSQHIGTVGERRDFTLTIRFVTSFEGMYGTTYVTGMNDADGNVVIYKGSTTVGERGETITLKATIKAHGEREGVKQTMISRPKVAA